MRMFLTYSYFILFFNELWCVGEKFILFLLIFAETDDKINVYDSDITFDMLDTRPY